MYWYKKSFKLEVLIEVKAKKKEENFGLKTNKRRFE
jgi:hypothetical protein